MPVESSFAAPNKGGAEIASARAMQVLRLQRATHVLSTRKAKNKPIGIKVPLLASAVAAPSTQSPIAPHVPQMDPLSIISMEDQRVRSGLLIAMKLAASEPTTEPVGPVEIDDGSISSLQSHDSEVTAKPPKPRRNSKKQKATAEPVPLEKLKFLTFAQTALRYQVHTEKALRHLQAQAEAYLRYPKAGLRSNGFIDCIFRPDGQRKLLVIAASYEAWLVANSSQRHKLNATVRAAGGQN